MDQPRASTTPQQQAAYDRYNAKIAAQQEQKAREEARAKREQEENEKIRAEVRADAKKLGFDVDFDRDLDVVLRMLRDGRTTIGQWKQTLVMTGGSFVAFQVIDQDNVLMRDTASDVLIWLKGYRAGGGELTILEGTALDALECAYFAVRGVKTYSTVIGTRQAVVVEPIM